MAAAKQLDRAASAPPDADETAAAADALVAFLAAALSPASRVPLYEQLMAGVARAVRDGLLPPGAALPPEPELARRLGLSRQTVGQALTGLARRGLVTRRRGIGTFVAGPTVEQPLDRLYSFVRTLGDRGGPAGARLLGARLTVDPEASALLAGRPDGLVFELTRLFLADGAPLVVETVYLPQACGERLPGARLATDVVYDLLREACGIDVTHAEETLRLALLEPTEAALLGVAAGDPAFRVERTAYAGARPVELRRSLVRGDRSRFRVHLEGPALVPAGPERGEPAS